MKNFFIRNIDAEDYLESFLISAVFSILAIRFYLTVFGYPQLGRGGFHIAHMLWGGFFMLGAIVLFSAFLNKPVHRAAAVLGGIGFGAFIDELGKFITRDNNYYFQPTVALIYVVFIMMYFGFRLLDKEKRLVGKEYFVNAIELTKQLVLKPNKTEKEKALRLFKSSNDPLALEFMHIVSKVDVDKVEKSGYLDNFEVSIENFYFRIIKNKRFTEAVIIFFILFSLFNLWRAYWLIGLYFIVGGVDWSFIDFALLTSTLVSAVFVIFGVLRIFRSRRQGYILLRFAILTSILLTQFFAFYRDQFGALFAFIVNVFVLVVLHYMIKKEPHIVEVE